MGKEKEAGDELILVRAKKLCFYDNVRRYPMKDPYQNKPGAGAAFYVKAKWFSERGMERVEDGAAISPKTTEPVVLVSKKGSKESPI
jgi:hypothetical protein